MNKKLMKEQKFPIKKDVIDTIKNDIDLGGSDLVGYRIDIE